MTRRRVAVLAALATATAIAATSIDEPASADAPSANPAPRREAAAPRRARASAPATAVGAPEVTPVGGGAGDPSPGVRKWKVEGLPGTFREVVAPDGSENLEEKLTYRLRRLRFRLADAATACSDGVDGPGQVALGYTLVVAGGRMRTDDVTVLASDLGDARLEACIVDAVRRLEAPAPDLPDGRRAQQTAIGRHDLFVRARAAE